MARLAGNRSEPGLLGASHPHLRTQDPSTLSQSSSHHVARIPSLNAQLRVQCLTDQRPSPAAPAARTTTFVTRVLPALILATLSLLLGARHACAATLSTERPDATVEAIGPQRGPDTTITGRTVHDATTEYAEDLEDSQETAPREVVIVDTALQNWQQLADAARRQPRDGRRVAVIVARERGGIRSIGDALARYRNLDAIHVLSHGSAGAIVLGGVVLSERNLSTYADTLRDWRTSLRPGGDLLLYGCDVASTLQGRQFVDDVARLTGANVAASTNATGSRQLGGDWTLEYHAGDHLPRAQVVVDTWAQQDWFGLLAVTYQSSAELAKASSTTNTLTSFNPGSGSYRLLVVSLAFEGSLPTGISVTYGGVALTAVPNSSGTAADNTASTQFFYLKNPSSTPANIVASWTGSRRNVLGAIAFNGVDQTTPIRNGTFTTGTTATPAITVSSVTGDMTMASVLTEYGSCCLTTSTQTERWNDPSSNLVGAQATSTGAGASSVTHNWTNSGAGTWAASGVNIVAAYSISGTVFEDTNYGGGSGRDLATSSGGRVNGATVELYSPSSGYVSSTTTASDGTYSFSGLSGSAGYFVRVLPSTVLSTRTGTSSSLVPVQTYRYEASWQTPGSVTNEVGGEIPSSADSAAAQTLAWTNCATENSTCSFSGTKIVRYGTGSSYTVRIATGGVSCNNTVFGDPSVGNIKACDTLNTYMHSASSAHVASSDVSGVDFGFNFDTVTNTNNSGIGSLRQAMTNANTLTGDASLTQSGKTGAVENLVFMISNGTSANGLRSANNYFTTSAGAYNVATVTPTSAMPTVSSTLVLDAQTQPGWTANPIIELRGDSAGANINGLTLNASNTILRGFIVNRFTGEGVFSSSGNSLTIQGNWIGVDAAGTTAAGNAKSGIWLSSASATGHTVGGTSATQRNVLSGNTGFEGVAINGGSGHTIQGNYIGTNATASATIANGGQGVKFYSSTTGASVGGTAAGAGNVIAGNTFQGVAIQPGASGVAILGNSIYGNATPGIDLGQDGVTANDGAKVGGTANQQMDFPVFTAATLSGTTLTVTGYVGSAANQSTFASARVEVFKSDNSGTNGQGQTYLGFVTTDASGNFNSTITGVSGVTVNSTKITATATDGSNNTSEFSANVTVTPITTLATGTDPGNASLAPGGAATMADAFTFQTDSSTDTVSAVTVSLGTGAAAGLSLVEITDTTGATVYGSTANPSSDTPTITLTTNITSTTSATTYKIRVTPKSHSNMPAPAGATYTVTALVSSWTSPGVHAGSDTAGTTITIDNLSPGDVTAATATSGNAQVSLSWTNPGDADLASIVVLRRTTSVVTDTPVEGTTYTVLADHRRTPYLQTTNSLFGAPNASLEHINTTNEAILRAQAKAVTATSDLFLVGVLHAVSKDWQLGGDVRMNRISGTSASNCLVILPGTSTLFLNPNATTDAPCSLQALPGTGNIWTYTLQAIGTDFPFEKNTFVVNASYINSPTYRGESLTLNSLGRFGQQWQLDTFLILYHQKDSADVELYRVTPTLRVDYRFSDGWTIEGSGGVEKTITESPLQKDRTVREFFFFGVRWDFS